MKKFVIAGAILACVLVTTIFAAQTQQPAESKDELILQKLDKILQNQADMMESLKFVKNRSR